MKAREVMTSPVVSVDPERTVVDVADLLLTHRISAVPVVLGNDRLIGIVSEGDLTRRAEIGTAERSRAWWRRLLADNTTLAKEYVKAYSTRVGDIMTRKVITVMEDTALADVVTLLEKHRIRRVPVVRGDRVIAIVSRADLIRGLVSARTGQSLSSMLDDDAIRKQVLDALRRRPWASIGATDITVRHGIVEYWGLCRSQEGRTAERVVAENIPGVVRVEDHRVVKGVPYPLALQR